MILQISNFKIAVACFSATVFFYSCTVLETRPVRQMAYAESAMQAATVAGAETNPVTSSIFILARDQLARARSFYRLKNFRDARYYAMRARRLAEEAEWKASKGVASDSNGTGDKVESLIK